jgi:hypothetical protein
MKQTPDWSTVAEEILKTAEKSASIAGEGLQHESGAVAVAAANIVLQTLGRALVRGIEAAEDASDEVSVSQ